MVGMNIKPGPNGGQMWRKLPVEVEVIQMTDDNWEDVYKFADWLARWDRDTGAYFVYDKLHDSWIQFKIGDWIARGPKGEHYPIEATMFKGTYQPVTISATRERGIDLAKFGSDVAKNSTDEQKLGLRAGYNEYLNQIRNSGERPLTYYAWIASLGDPGDTAGLDNAGD
jgi:hypothetical protein